MKIFLVVVYYLPSPKSSAALIFDLGQELLKQGHEVSIITISETLNSNYSVTHENGLDVLRIKSGKIDGANKFFRFINEFLLSIIIWEKGKKFFNNRQCDLVIWYSPSIFFSLLIKKFKLKYNCKSYLILRDIFPQWAVDTGLLKKGFIFKFLQYFEKEQYKIADFIGVQSPKNLLYFDKEIFKNKYNVHVLYNWANLDKTKLPSSNYRLKFNLLGKIVFFYGGNLGVAQDLENVIRLAQKLSSTPNVHFLLVGDGTETIRLQKIIRDLNLQNFSIHNSVSQDEYLAMLSEFDVGLISLDKKFKTPNFPGKMLGYMYYNKPILASINFGNDLQDLIEDYKIGLVSINGDDEVFFNNALKFVKDSEFRISLGNNGRLLLNNLFSVESAAKQILSYF